jgi:hypothetical protein
MPQSLSYFFGEASLQQSSIASVMLPLMMAAQAKSVVGICQTLPPQLAVLVALTEVVVVDILVVGLIWMWTE